MVAISFVLRLWFATIYHPPGWFVRSDMQRDDRFAQHLPDGQLDRQNAYTPAGYPALLAVVYRLFGHDARLESVGWVQALPPDSRELVLGDDGTASPAARSGHGATSPQREHRQRHQLPHVTQKIEVLGAHIPHAGRVEPQHSYR